jgi:hypothetical protein
MQDNIGIAYVRVTGFVDEAGKIGTKTECGQVGQYAF